MSIGLLVVGIILSMLFLSMFFIGTVIGAFCFCMWRAYADTDPSADTALDRALRGEEEWGY